MTGRFSGAIVHAILLLGLFGSTPQAWGGLNGCPIAFPQSISVAGGGLVNFQLMATDPDGDALTFVIVSAPAHGVVVVNVGTGAGTYTPSPGYCGPDSFRFKVSDDQCESNEATVSITVCPATPTATATGTSTATATRTATGTATATSTATPTATPVPEGGACMETAQCEPPLSCIDEVCTRPPAPVPALTPALLIVAVMLLAAIAAVGVWRRQHR